MAGATHNLLQSPDPTAQFKVQREELEAMLRAYAETCHAANAEEPFPERATPLHYNFNQ